VLEAFDVPAHAVRLHVRTAHADKSVLDPWTNLLRATTEAMSAAIGTADTLLVEAYGYDAHLAANVAHILAEEAHLDAVADPAGGSYYVESLTDALAREAWMLFQQVEAAGGYAAFVASGQRDAQVHVSRAAREAAVASRRRILVSVNSYPSPAGSESAASPWPEADAGDGLSAARLAVPFEAIRARTARHTAATGHTPVVHLLTRGDVRVSTSRATFCRNVFGCAGFDVTQGESLPAHADLVVLCGPDNEYVALAQELVGETSAPVLVAGYPTTLIDALTSAGVQGFVHVRSDIVETLSSWQDRLGLAP
jgi:methylmalonyl-CoA mutase